MLCYPDLATVSGYQIPFEFVFLNTVSMQASEAKTAVPLLRLYYTSPPFLRCLPPLEAHPTPQPELLCYGTPSVRHRAREQKKKRKLLHNIHYVARGHPLSMNGLAWTEIPWSTVCCAPSSYYHQPLHPRLRDRIVQTHAPKVAMMP